MEVLGERESTHARAPARGGGREREDQKFKEAHAITRQRDGVSAPRADTCMHMTEGVG